MALKYLIDLDLSGNELQNAALQTLADNPQTPSPGQVYFNTSLKGVFVYNGTSWGRVGLTADGTTIAESGGEISVINNSHLHTIANVTGLQTALDGKVDDSQVLTNVPANAVFTDTTYSAGNGINLSGTTFEVGAGDGLSQGAGGLAVDSTVVRTSGDQIIDGNKRFSRNVIVDGDLTVSGTTTTVNSTQVTLADDTLTLASNAGAPEEIITAGIEVNRGPEASKTSIFYRETDQRWFFTIGDGSEFPISLPGEFDTNTQRSDEQIRDVIGSALRDGGATTVTVDDAANTITISSTDTNTTYSAGDGLGLSGTTFINAYLHEHIILDPIETADYVNINGTEAVVPFSLILQVKEVDLVTGSVTNVITEWDVPGPGQPARVFLPVNDANKAFAISFSGQRA